MPVRRTAAPRTVRTTRTKPTLKQKLLGPKRTTAARRAPAQTTTTTTTTRTTRTTPAHGVGHHTHKSTPAVHHHQRKASVGDKVSGALMKLRGSITHRPGLKAAGTRRMHGTDGRNARRVY